MSAQITRETDGTFVLSCQYRWLTPPASIPAFEAANDASFSVARRSGRPQAWSRSVNKWKRVVPIAFASLMGLTACGAVGSGSSGATTSLTWPVTCVGSQCGSLSAAFEAVYAFAAQGFPTASATMYPAWSAGATTLSPEALSGNSDDALQNADNGISPIPNLELSATGNSAGDLLALYGRNARGSEGEGGYGD